MCRGLEFSWATGEVFEALHSDESESLTTIALSSLKAFLFAFFFGLILLFEFGFLVTLKEHKSCVDSIHHCFSLHFDGPYKSSFFQSKAGKVKQQQRITILGIKQQLISIAVECMNSRCWDISRVSEQSVQHRNTYLTFQSIGND